MSGEREGDRFRWQDHAGRIKLGSPVAAAVVTGCVCLLTEVYSSRFPWMNTAAIVAAVLNGLLAVAGSTVGSLMVAHATRPERIRAAISGAALGLVGYWFALMA